MLSHADDSRRGDTILKAGGWEQNWTEGVTPWDLQGPTPALLTLLKNAELPKGRALVPGCGSVSFLLSFGCVSQN